jgi:hypothetical protein
MYVCMYIYTYICHACILLLTAHDMHVSSSSQVESLAKRLKLKLYRTCVSENLNVDKVSRVLCMYTYMCVVCFVCVCERERERESSD